MNEKIKDKKYEEWYIYSYNDNGIELGEKILKDQYLEKETYKDTKRNYVAKVEIDKKLYILKEIRSEVNIPQRKIQTLLKKGEALTTLINLTEAIYEGVEELVKPIVALVKRRGVIKKSFLLMEYIEGEVIKTSEEIDQIIDIIKKIHKLGRSHGDLNTSNFIKSRDKVMVLDTQMKKEKFFFFKRSYDIFTLEEDLLVKALKYNVREKYGKMVKDIGYYVAFFIKKFKRIKLVKNIKKKKKELRKKGWKI